MIAYTALEYTRPEDVRYQYWLEGYDADWRDGGTQRQATYTNLSPGSYTFHVRASLGGIWGEAARLSIKRLPYFWETAWFMLLAVYDVTGRQVAVLVSGRMASGRHEVVWQAGDLPSGVYLVRMQTDAFSEVRRMALIK